MQRAMTVLQRTRQEPPLSNFNATAIKLSSHGLGLAKLRLYAFRHRQ
jgi:hypothetical protein